MKVKESRRALFVIANPSPESFSHAMADAAGEILSARNTGGAELILVFHPNWWGQPPAILKGSTGC